ncbi:MAG TPA: reverse transcriptase domain-containing protein [Hyphomicrobiaceae bacterium]|nr:reverse transcriptase domain-containing protein [Hyphomicrobiaceae bacterium]
MARLARRIGEKRFLKIVRAVLNAGMMQGGVVIGRHEGTPEGGPLSPVLAELLLDDLDQDLEQRGHRFCRYADDCIIYVRSKAAGKRVMAYVTAFIEGHLRLEVKDKKSAVAPDEERSFLSHRYLSSGEDRSRTERPHPREAAASTVGPAQPGHRVGADVRRIERLHGGMGHVAPPRRLEGRSGRAPRMASMQTSVSAQLARVLPISAASGSPRASAIGRIASSTGRTSFSMRLACCAHRSANGCRGS